MVSFVLFSNGICMAQLIGAVPNRISLTLTSLCSDLDLHVCSLHDRKLFLLGACTLLSLNDVRRHLFSDGSQHILSAAVTVFTGLQRAYECQLIYYSFYRLFSFISCSIGFLLLA